MNEDMRRFNKLNNFFMYSFITLFLLLFSAIYINFKFPHHDIINFFYEKCIKRCFEIISLDLKLFLSLKYFLIVILLTFFVYSLIKTLYKLLKAYTYSKSLERTDFPLKIKRIIKDLSIEESRIILFKSDLNVAFTSGLFFPKIYVSTELIKSLNEEEIKAVLFHEESHLRRKDPLKSLIVYFFSNLFFFLPISKNIFSVFKSGSEFIADDYVQCLSISSLNLASAIVKVKRNNNTSIKSYINFYNNDFANERLERLLKIKNKNRSGNIPLKKLILSIIIYFLLIFSVFPYERVFQKDVNYQANLSYKCFCCEMNNSNNGHFYCQK